MVQKICQINDLDEGASLEFRVKNATEEKEAFLIYFKQQFYAYINHCPHTGVNLNWQPGQFFSLDGVFLQCSLHGAFFKPENGLCVRGPCQGQSLGRLNIDIRQNTVFLNESNYSVVSKTD